MKGEIFETSQRSDGNGGWSRPLGKRKLVSYRQTFNLTKYDATDEIIVHICLHISYQESNRLCLFAFRHFQCTIIILLYFPIYLKYL